MIDTLFPNTLLQNRYQIIRMLGQGGMGAVYQAWDMRLQGLIVAVKENFDNSPAAQTQFQTEAAILARLSHPALTRVTDYFIEPSGRQYLVMDFVEGQDLEQIVGQRGRIAESDALRWITEMLNALEYLHGQNPPIIHRDIKPANIKIRPDGRAILVDFGIAKVFNPSQKTQAGARAGTPGYAPLEQYGQGITDARSDLYAIGATLYFLITSLIPPEATEIASGLRQLTPPSAWNIPISPTIEQAILRAMASYANQRFQSAREFRDAINAPAQQTVPSRTPSRPQAFASTASANPQLASSAMPNSMSVPRAPARSSSGAVSVPNYVYASWGSRAIAYLVDSFLSSLPFILNYCCVGLFGSTTPSGTSSRYSSSDSVIGLLALFLSCALCLTALFIPFYFIRMTTVSGQTIGKRMFGIKVVRFDDGKPPSLGYSILRYIGYMLNSFTFYIGWLLPLFDEKKQALHDKIAGTIVIRT